MGCTRDVEKVVETTKNSIRGADEELGYISFPDKRFAKGGWTAALLILGVEVCERLATLGIGLNLVVYLHNHMHLPIPTAANVVTNFMGASYITCLLGGFVADTYLGRFSTIAVGASIQLTGMILMILSATLPSLRPITTCAKVGGEECKVPSVHQQAVLYGALYMVALGTGGVKSCVSGLGADQFKEQEEEGRKMMQSFFNWFGVGLSMACILAVTVLAYLQDNVGYGVGYAISAACVAFSLSLFLLASPLYVSKPPQGSPLAPISRVLLAAWRNRSLEPPSQALNPSTIMPSILHTNQFLCLDKAALSRRQSTDANEQVVWMVSSLAEVEDVKMFLRLLPILATTIVFWTCNAQMITFSTEQAATLDRRLGQGFQIPPASLQLFVQISNITTLTLYDRLLIPLARRWRSNEYGITSLQRIGIGLFFSTLSLAVASLVEKKRLHVAHHFQFVYGQGAEMPMSVFYLAPQYCLLGIGDAFGYIGQLEFFFRESPDGMRSLGTGLCLSTVSLGFFFSSALVDGVNKWSKHGSNEGWLTNDLNSSRLDNFYLFIAFCSFLSFLAYLGCSYWYVYRDKQAINKGHMDDVSSCASKENL